MNSVMTTHPCPPWVGPARMWAPSKSALERKSWDWNRGDEKNSGAMGPGRRVRKGDGRVKRHREMLETGGQKIEGMEVSAY